MAGQRPHENLSKNSRSRRWWIRIAYGDELAGPMPSRHAGHVVALPGRVRNMLVRDPAIAAVAATVGPAVGRWRRRGRIIGARRRRPGIVQHETGDTV